MSNLEDIRINKKIITNTLSIFFNSVNSCLKFVENIDELSNLKDHRDILLRYYIDSTKLFKHINIFTTKSNLLDYYIKLNYTEDEIKNLFENLLLFEENNIILCISKENMAYFPYDSEKYIITPLGTIFLFESLNAIKEGKEELLFNEVLNKSLEDVGYFYNKLILDRIHDNFKKVGGNLNREEISYVLFLLLTQSISRENNVYLKRPVDKDLTIPLNFISNYIFNEKLFDKEKIDEWIRRSTASLGLRAKLINKYNKEEIKETDSYLVYLDVKDDQINLIVMQILQDIDNFENGTTNEYYKKIIKLIDTYINNQSIIYDNNPQISYKIIKHPITTFYLMRLLNLFKNSIKY